MDTAMLRERGRLRRWELALLVGVAAALLAGVWLDREQAALSDKVIRLHVIANSDTEADQALKLRVRDRILEEAAGYFQAGQTVEEAAAELQGQGYGKLKDRVSECVIETLAPLQSEHKRLMADKAYLQGVLKENAEIANRMALRTLRKVQRKIGFAERLK